MKTAITVVGIAATYVVISSVIILGFATATGLVADDNDAAYIIISSIIVLGLAVAAGLFAGDNDAANPYTTGFNEDSTMRTTIAVIGIAAAFVVITGIIVVGFAAAAGWIAGDNAFADPYAEPDQTKPREKWVSPSGYEFICRGLFADANNAYRENLRFGYSEYDAKHLAFQDVAGLHSRSRMAPGFVRVPGPNVSAADVQHAYEHCAVGR